jgi:hypothetical protein
VIQLKTVQVSFYQKWLTTVAVKNGVSFYSLANNGPIGLLVEDLEQIGFYFVRERTWYETESGTLYAFFPDWETGLNGYYGPLFDFSCPTYKESEVTLVQP